MNKLFINLSIYCRSVQQTLTEAPQNVNPVINDLCAASLQDFLKQGETVSSRCDELQSLIKRGCNKTLIENPLGKRKILKNKLVTDRSKAGGNLRPEDITQVQPQKVSLTLRSGA